MTIKLVLEIACGSAAFGESPESDEFGYEVARILRHVADRFEQGYTSVYMNDSNGNLIGHASVKHSEEQP